MRYFVLFLLPWAQLAAAQAPALPQPPHTILVRGTAEQELEPEKLDLLLTYRFSDNVKENGRTQEQEQALQQVLKQAGIGPEKLVLEDLSASGYGGFSKTANTNVALTKVYRLRLDNPKILNDLIPRLVQTGADNLRVTNLENTRLEAVKADVAGRAAANARQKAQSAVKLAGGQLAGVVAMVEILPDGSGNDPLASFRLGYDKKMTLGSRSDTPGEIGGIFTPNLRKIKVQAVYDVVFEIK